MWQSLMDPMAAASCGGARAVTTWVPRGEGRDAIRLVLCFFRDVRVVRLESLKKVG